MQILILMYWNGYMHPWWGCKVLLDMDKFTDMDTVTITVTLTLTIMGQIIYMAVPRAMIHRKWWKGFISMGSELGMELELEIQQGQLRSGIQIVP